LYDFFMNRQILSKALIFGLCTGAIALTGCSTVESRISDHPDIYQSLSPRDQALVSHGQIRSGMPRSAVWLAWGDPDRRISGNMRGHETETWIYVNYAPAPYPYGYPYGPYWGPWGYGPGYGGVAFVRRRHHGRAFFFFGSPFYDPFYYSYIPPSIPYPYRTVTFSRGRVVSYQYLAGG
jgi:hypothetical protein